jgi:hypothetical protein
MSKIPFSEVKRDIRKGHNYLTYEAKWYGGDVAVILEGYNGTVIFDFTRWHFSKKFELDSADDYRIFSLPIAEFLASTYKEIVERANYCLFY